MKRIFPLAAVLILFLSPVVAAQKTSFFGRPCRDRRGGLSWVYADRQTTPGHNPIPGGQIHLNLWTKNTTISGINLWVVGASRSQWGPIKLPLDLGGLGYPFLSGCNLYVSADLFMGDPRYKVLLIPLPKGPRLSKVRLFFQHITLNLTGPPGRKLASIWTSDAVDITIK